MNGATSAASRRFSRNHQIARINHVIRSNRILGANCLIPDIRCVTHDRRADERKEYLLM